MLTQSTVSSTESSSPRLLDRLREAIRRLHYSRRTEEAYIHWTKRFICFQGKRHPSELGESEVTAFLNYLATDRNVAASTQNQALSAVLFLYKEVLGTPLDWLDGLVRAKRPKRMPVVLTRGGGRNNSVRIAGNSLAYGQPFVRHRDAIDGVSSTPGQRY
jgi:hypothetical protein